MFKKLITCLIISLYIGYVIYKILLEIVHWYSGEYISLTKLFLLIFSAGILIYLFPKRYINPLLYDFKVRRFTRIYPEIALIQDTKEFEKAINNVLDDPETSNQHKELINAIMEDEINSRLLKQMFEVMSESDKKIIAFSKKYSLNDKTPDQREFELNKIAYGVSLYPDEDRKLAKELLDLK